VGPRTGLDDVENRKFSTLQGLDLRPLSLPARSQSLYRLRYRRFSRKKRGQRKIKRWMHPFFRDNLSSGAYIVSKELNQDPDSFLS
jgi:hypothetical protein